MKKKKLKGFTLVELIVVMAIFGIIMVAVMSLIDPVSKIMKRTTLEEANAASVDNVKHYLEGSLRYATAIEAHLGDLEGLDETQSPPAPAVVTMDQAVLNFADQYFLNKSDNNDDPYQGKIHVMEVDNVNGGRVNEYVYDFTAGYSYIEANPATQQFIEVDGSCTKVIEHAKFEDWDNSGDPTDPRRFVTENKDVINPVYYEYYSFFIEPGYKELLTTNIPAPNREHYTVTFKDIERVTASGATVKHDSFTPDMFSMSVVTYKNDSDFPKAADDTATPGVDETRLFESPSAISNISMSLVNTNSKFASLNNFRNYYGPVRYKGSGMIAGALENMTPNDKVDVAPNDGNWDYEESGTLLAGTNYSQNQSLFTIKNTFQSNSPNFYFIFTLPDGK